MVIPLFASDQFDNARRVAAVGAGTALEDVNVDERLAGDMVPAGPQAVEGLPTAVLQTVRDSDLTEAARRIAAEIEQLPTVDRCVSALEGILG